MKIKFIVDIVELSIQQSGIRGEQITVNLDVPASVNGAVVGYILEIRQETYPNVYIIDPLCIPHQEYLTRNHS